MSLLCSTVYSELYSEYKKQLEDTKSFIDKFQEFNEVFYFDKIKLDDECKSFLKQEGVSDTLTEFKNQIESIEDWNVENISNAINNIKEKGIAKGKMLYMPIRIKVSGLMHGPELPDTIYLLGKEKVLNRLED